MTADPAGASAGPALRRDTQRLALFDLDGTLLAGDTDALWCDFLVDVGVLDRAVFEPANRSVAERYRQGTISSAEFCAFYAATLAGRTPAGWAAWRARFVAERIEPRIGPAARSLVEAHRGQGDLLVLTTATNRFLAEPIAAALGIETLLATELALTEHGVFSGANEGVLNMGAGKVARLSAWLSGEGLPAGNVDSAVFYSDSINDLPLLLAVGRAVAVDPDARLRREAEERGWQILAGGFGSLRPRR